MSNIDDELAKVGTQALDTQQLKDLKSKLKESITAQFKKRSMGSEEDVKVLIEDLNKKFEDKFVQFKENNNNKWKVFYSDLS